MLDKSLKNIFPGRPKRIAPIDIAFKRSVGSSLIDNVTTFISKSFQDLKQIGLTKITVGLSGGVDSSVCAWLFHKIIPDKSFAVIVDFGIKEDRDFSIKIAEEIGIEYKIIDAKQILDDHLQSFHTNSVLARIHLRSRIINDLIFQVADNESAAVIDTTDKSELLLARHAESFMGHIAPLSDLYKSEVYDMAEYFLLREVKEKEPGCPDLLDKDAFGVEWETLDKILYLFTEHKLSTSDISSKYQIDPQWLEKIEKRLLNQHLRVETKRLLL